MSVEKDDFQNTILFFRPQGLPEVYGPILESDKKTKKYDFQEIAASGKAEDLIVKHDSASLLFCIQNRDDLVQLLTLCKVNVEKIRQGVLKVGGLNLTGSHKLDDILKKSGVSDVFLDSISAKTLDYKLNFWSKGIKTNLKKIQTVIKGNFKFDGKTAGGASKETAGSEASGGKVNVVSALTFPSDCWLLDNAPEQPRKVMGHWIVELVGPSPYAGRWVEIKNAETSEDLLWEWVPLHVEVFQFIEHEGRWVAKGKQPQFLWKSNSWKFMGMSPALIFQLNEGEPVVRFFTENDNLSVAEDSKYALGKKRLIEESFDPKIVQKKDLDKSKENLENDEEELSTKKALNTEEDEEADELEMLAKKEVRKIDDLVGKAAAENIGGSLLKGKFGSKKESPEENFDDLEQEVNKFDGRLVGKIQKKDDDGKTGNKGLRDTDLKMTNSSVDEIAREIKKKKEEEAQKKESAGFKPKTVDGFLGGKFKTLKEEEKAKEKESSLASEEIKKSAKREQLRSDKTEDKNDHSKTKLQLEIEIEKKKKNEGASSRDTLATNKSKSKDLLEALSDEHADELDLDGDVSEAVKRQDQSQREGKKSPFQKDSGVLPVAKAEREGLKGIKRDLEEKEGRKHSGIAEQKQKDISSGLTTDKINNDPMSGAGGTDNLEDDPLSGEGDEADRLNKFLHGKTAWKDEVGGHLRLTKLSIELLMKLKNKAEEVPVKLGDVIDNLLVLFVPIGVYKYDQKASIKVVCTYGALDLNFTVVGKIVDLYENDDETECCNLELSEYNEANLKQLKRLFGDRQKDITNFFIQAKGIT